MPDYVLYRVRALLPLAGDQGHPWLDLCRAARSGEGMDNNGWQALAQLLGRARHGRGDAQEME